MQTLLEFQAFQNGIKEEGMALLIQALSFNKKIEIIKFNDNTIKNAAEHLPNMLANLHDLQVIDISDSLLGNTHAIAFFKALIVITK